MGWRHTYYTLVELFPQVDTRLIKGAALEHGDDMSAAAEFILNDVLGPNEGKSDDVQLPDTAVHHGSLQEIGQSSTSAWEEQAVIATDSGTNPFLQGSPNSFQEIEQSSASGGEEQAVAGTDSGTSLDDSKQDEQVVVSVNSGEPMRSSESQSASAILHITTEAEAEEVTGEAPNGGRDELLTTKEMRERIEPGGVTDTVADGCKGVRIEPVQEDELGLAEIVRELFLLIRRPKDGEARTPDISTSQIPGMYLRYKELAHRTSAEDVKSKIVVGSESLPDPCIYRKVMEEDKSEVENSREKSEAALCDRSTSSASLTQEGNPAVSEGGVQIDLVHDESLPEFPAVESGPPFGLEGGQGLDSSFDQYSSQMQDHKQYLLDLEAAEVAELMRVGPDEEYTTKKFTADEFPVYDDSISVPDEIDEAALDNGLDSMTSTQISAITVPRRAEVDEVALDDGLDSMMSIQKSAIKVDEMALDDGLDSMMSIQKSAISEEMDQASWENINCISIIQMNHMEPLDNLVEEAKTDKEALISSIEEIRVLRLMTDQAEYAARQTSEEAACGGLDVMVKVDEMRKMLFRAREANSVHAGELFGEKAVLATEARELHFRLAQVNSEKATAIAALNEIKATLQARIENAVREREAAEQEKIQKELFAKEALAKEEALMAKVAQESRELDAEAEACTKIRDFLIERGSIVDALQGEVAVLREDAESLKKDLESMSLSYSGFHVNMSSHAGSDIYNSIGSKSGKFIELYGQALDNSGAVSSRSNSGPHSLRTVAGVQKCTSDRKSWSSLPSLLRGLSGSQDLNSSTHSGYSSHASNSLSASRDALDVNHAEKSPLLGSENSLTDIKYPSLPYSPTSPEEKKQEERELLKAKMAMFPGEELEMEYLGIPNLDVFRTEKSHGSRAETDEEDWQMLEKVSSGSSSRSSGDK